MVKLTFLCAHLQLLIFHSSILQVTFVSKAAPVVGTASVLAKGLVETRLGFGAVLEYCAREGGAFCAGHDERRCVYDGGSGSGE
jgi:hypothetical protein